MYNVIVSYFCFALLFIHSPLHNKYTAHLPMLYLHKMHKHTHTTHTKIQIHLIVSLLVGELKEWHGKVSFFSLSAYTFPFYLNFVFYPVSVASYKIHFSPNNVSVLFLFPLLFTQEHIQEVLDKWTQIEDEIWAKVIVFERNRRVAKAYARAPVLTINGSDDGFDGMK